MSTVAFPLHWWVTVGNTCKAAFATERDARVWACTSSALAGDTRSVFRYDVNAAVQVVHIVSYRVGKLCAMPREGA